jgi:hypothetical protein
MVQRNQDRFGSNRQQRPEPPAAARSSMQTPVARPHIAVSKIVMAKLVVEALTAADLAGHIKVG